MDGCIFCGGKPVTKEHTWAKWLRQYVPMTAESHEQSGTGIRLGQVQHHQQKRVGGDLRRRGIKCVCSSCNGGWMSALQNRNKDVLTALATSNPILLSAEQQLNLATWIATFVSCSEHRDKKGITISQFNRYIIYKHQVPPPTWAIWIARHRRGADYKNMLKHHRMRLRNDVKHMANVGSEVNSANTRVTTFAVGDLFVHAFGCNVDNTLASKTYWLDGEKRLFRIWPVEIDSFYWSPPHSLTDEEAGWIGNRLMIAAMHGDLFTAGRTPHQSPLQPERASSHSVC